MTVLVLTVMVLVLTVTVLVLAVTVLVLTVMVLVLTVTVLVLAVTVLVLTVMVLVLTVTVYRNGNCWLRTIQLCCQLLRSVHKECVVVPSTPTYTLTPIQAHPLTLTPIQAHSLKNDLHIDTKERTTQLCYISTNLGVWECGVLTECGHYVCSWRELKCGSQRKLMKKCVVTAALATPSSPIAQRSVLATHVYANTHTCMHEYMHAHTHVYSHIHTHACTHTYTHTKKTENKTNICPKPK